MNHHRSRRVWALLLAAVVAVVLALPATALAGGSAGAAVTKSPAAVTKSPVAATKSAQAAAAKYAATIRDCRAAAKALLKQTGAASLSLALTNGKKIVWQQTFGYADTAAKAAPQATTMYGLGSVSKMLATIATMKLVDRGQVSLDAPVWRYLPTFSMLSPDYRQVTVRMLLNHSSGFPGSEYRNMYTFARVPTYPDQVMNALAQSRLKATPGYMSVYCNDGFTLVEKLVPAITGKSYAQFVKDEIFTPLGMANSGYPETYWPIGTYAKCYDGGQAHPQEFFNCFASGGAYSTPSDMAKLAQMLMNGGVYKGQRILSNGSINAMAVDQTLRTYTPVQSDMMRYGLGWDTVTDGGLKAVGVTAWCKGGDTVDYHTGFVVAPKVKLAAIAQGVAPLSSSVLEGLGERMILHAMVDQGKLRRMPAKLSPVPPRIRTATAAQLAGMTGYWAKYSGLTRINPSPSNPQALTTSSLTANGWSDPEMTLRLRADGRFYVKDNPEGISMRTMRAGNRSYLIMNGIFGYGNWRTDLPSMQRIEAQDQISPAWQARVGKSWLAVNHDPSSAACVTDAGPLLTIGEIPGLPGYVTSIISGAEIQVLDPSKSDGAAYMFLQIPLANGRDLCDLAATTRGSEEWMAAGSTIHRPLATVPELVSGGNTVTFGGESYAEWRKLPSAGQATIAGATHWFLYDSTMKYLGSGTGSPATATAAQAGCYLMLYGAAGSTATVTLTP